MIEGVFFTQAPADWQAGPVPIVGTEYTSSSVVLKLARPVQGAATVSGGAGAHPPALPVDVTRNLPLLGFDRLEILGN